MNLEGVNDNPVQTEMIGGVAVRFWISNRDPTDTRHVLCLITTQTCPHCPRAVEKYPDLQKTISKKYSLRFAHIDLDRMASINWEDVHLPIPRGVEKYVSWFPTYLILNGQEWNAGQIPPYHSPHGFHGDVFAGKYDDNRWNFDMNCSPPTPENIVKWLGDIQEKHHIQFKESPHRIRLNTLKSVLKELPEIYHVFTMSVTWAKSETGGFSTSSPKFLPSLGLYHLRAMRGFFHSPDFLSYSDDQLFEFYRIFGLTEYFIPQMTPEYSANLFSRHLDLLIGRNCI